MTGLWVVDCGLWKGQTAPHLITHHPSPITVRLDCWAIVFLLALLSPTAQAAQVQHGGLSVTYSDTRDRQQLGAVFLAWDTAAQDLKALGLPPPSKVSVIAASSAANFAALTGEPANIAASTRGATIYTQRLSALALAGRLPITIRHEAFHTAQPAGIPRWLAEGLARTFSDEARTDSPDPTGLGSLSSDELDAQLLSRDPLRLKAAYAEATRRAGKLVRARGWKKALSPDPKAESESR